MADADETGFEPEDITVEVEEETLAWSELRFESTLVKWMYQSCELSWNAARWAEVNHSDEWPPISGNMSLMAFEAGTATLGMVCHFIHWVGSVKVKQGRIVHLDEQSRIKYSVPAAFPEIDFTDTKHILIVADVGHRMQKVRTHEREPMAPEAIRLKVMYEVAFARSGEGASTAMELNFDECILCEGKYHGPARVCPVCTLPFRETCSSWLRAFVSHNRDLCCTRIPPVQLPKAVFELPACDVCRSNGTFTRI